MSQTESSILEVCVVEDEARLRDLLVREIAAMGHRSSGYSSAESAWDHIAAGVDAVILDLNLPGMSGMKLLERMRLQKNNAAVVILTGFGAFESAVQSLRWKAEDYLTKPCSLADIDRVLANILARKREASRQQTIENAPRKQPQTAQISPPVTESESEERIPQTVEEIERVHILKVLTAHNDDKRSAAEELGISLRTLYNKLHAYRQQGYLD